MTFFRSASTISLAYAFACSSVGNVLASLAGVPLFLSAFQMKRTIWAHLVVGPWRLTALHTDHPGNPPVSERTVYVLILVKRPKSPLVIPVLPITRQQLSSGITRRGGGPQHLHFGFEKMVGDDQRLDRLSRITVTRRNGLIRGRLQLIVV